MSGTLVPSSTGIPGTDKSSKDGYRSVPGSEEIYKYILYIYNNL